MHHVAFDPDSRWIVTAAAGRHDGTARVWEAETGHPVATLLGRPAGSQPVFCGREQLITCTRDGQIRRWELRRLEVDAERCPLWAQVITGTELDKAGEVRGLSAEKWDRAREALRAWGRSR